MRATTGVACAILTSGLMGMPGAAAAQADLEGTLTFEALDGPALGAWYARPERTIFRDSTVVRGGRYSARLDRATEEGDASVLMLTVPVDFAGENLQLRGWLRTEDVTGFAGLWLRQDGRAGMVQFDNMQDRGPRGTTDWTEYSITLPIDERARTVVFGALLTGTGRAWVDDLELLVDGVRPSEAPEAVIVAKPAELDTEFDGGSGIDATSVAPRTVADLALLGQVWGFVKYHHPRVVAGDVNWDYELFRVLPRVLEAPDASAARAAVTTWVEGLGEPPPCAPCTALPEGGADLHLRPDVDWITDVDRLGERLSQALVRIHEGRPDVDRQYYVMHGPNVGNPDFSNELPYAESRAPDAGFRLLALYRFWNVIAYWFPYRDVIGEDWDGVLAEFVPRLLAAEDGDAYRLELMQLVARVHDTHANTWGELALRPPRGEAQVPVTVRFVEGQAVVTGYRHDTLGPASGLSAGDVIETIDGARVDSLVTAWRPYYAASNEPTRLRDVARTLTRGPAGPVTLTGRRADGPFELTTRRVPTDSLDRTAGATHDLPGETFRMLTPAVAYLKLSSIVAADIPGYLRRARAARVLVVDIRNYPSEFVVFSLGSHFVTQPTEFARFTRGDPANPGAFHFTPPLSLQPVEPFFGGRVVILVDEVSQSQAEYTAMAFRVTTDALVVGSTTAGADGNISPIPLPGGVGALISGIGVFYPDRTPTQRIGIVPDVEVRPTIAGIRAGRDEVLEAAVTRALGLPFQLPRVGR